MVAITLLLAGEIFVSLFIMLIILLLKIREYMNIYQLLFHILLPRGGYRQSSTLFWKGFVILD